MNIDPLKQKLTEIDAATLQDFILDLYLHHPELSDKIKALLLYNHPAALAKALGKQMQSLRRGRRFIDYRASFQRCLELLDGEEKESACNEVIKKAEQGSSLLNSAELLLKPEPAGSRPGSGAVAAPGIDGLFL